jgi:hypothetical protein
MIPRALAMTAPGSAKHRRLISVKKMSPVSRQKKIQA